MDFYIKKCVNTKCSLKVSKSQKHFFLNSWNSIAQKTNEILDKILLYEARAEIIWSNISLVFLGNWVSRKNAFEIYWLLSDAEKFCSSMHLCFACAHPVLQIRNHPYITSAYFWTFSDPPICLVLCALWQNKYRTERTKFFKPNPPSLFADVIYGSNSFLKSIFHEMLIFFLYWNSILNSTVTCLLNFLYFFLTVHPFTFIVS